MPTLILLKATNGAVKVVQTRSAGGNLGNGADQGVFSQTHNGLAVVGKTVQLKPAQRVVIDNNLLTGKGQPRAVTTADVTLTDEVGAVRVLVCTPSRYRVIYTIKDDILTVVVVRVGHRREVYR